MSVAHPRAPRTPDCDRDPREAGEAATTTATIDVAAAAKVIETFGGNPGGLGGVQFEGDVALLGAFDNPVTAGAAFAHAYGGVKKVDWAKIEKALAKRPWNASLKTLCWKIGASFVFVKANDNDVYGKVYAARKAVELERDAAGTFADQAAHSLESRKIRDADLRKTYESGHLPAGRLDLRARRYATKLFLSGWHEAAYFNRYGTLPPKPYVIEHGGHAHYTAPPSMHLIAGWAEARAKL